MTGEATWSWQGSLSWNSSPISLPEGTGPIDITSLERQWGARGFRLVTADTTGHTPEANVLLVCLLRAVTGPYLGSLCSCQNMGSSWEHLQLRRLRGAGLLCMLAQALWPQEGILPWAADCPSSGSEQKMVTAKTSADLTQVTWLGTSTLAPARLTANDFGESCVLSF